MREVTFDIETANVFASFSRGDLTALELSVVAVHDSATDTYTAYTKEELPQLWPIIEAADVLIGYNSIAFDVPILNKYYPGDLAQIHSLDLMMEVYDVLGRRLRLQNLAEATLGVGKSADGLKAVEWWQKGEVQKVKDYCIQDVRVTRGLYDYAVTNGKLKYKDLRDIRDIKLDTKKWKQSAGGSAFTHTLPF